VAGDLDRIVNYCAALAANNNRAWFHEHHGEYDAARADFAELLEHLRFAVCRAAPALEADVMYARVKDWTYRIPRDARIPRDLPPYNPSFRAYISADRRSWLPIGYFVHVGADECFYGTGVWTPETEKTNRIRDYISAHAGQLEELLARAGVRLQGEKVKTMPRGYGRDCPGAEWVRHKNWVFFEHLPDKAMRSFGAFSDAVEEMTRRFEPVRQFLLTAATGEQTRAEELQTYFSDRWGSEI